MKMMKQRRNIAIVCLVGLSLVASVASSRGQGTPPANNQATSTNRETGPTSPQESLVRQVYRKLEVFSRAALSAGPGEPSRPANAGDALSFKLANFRVGPIGEIHTTPHSEMVTLPSGEIITLTRTVTQHNKGEEFVSYRAEWTKGQYASGYDRGWTISDVLYFQPDKNYDIGEYASYEVTVSFRGKARTYRALALFHNPHGSMQKLKPEIWDAVVGMGGVMTDVWSEGRNPARHEGDTAPGARLTPDESPASVSASYGDMIDPTDGGGERVGRWAWDVMLLGQ
jgi:hypothetical protein